MESPRLQLTNPVEFFREKVTKAIATLNLSVDDQTEFYLVNLLCDFIDPTKINQTIGDIDVLDTPLAIILKQALESPPSQQFKLLKGLGDTSLYVAGFFQDFFISKIFDVDYYITIGSNAYSKISDIMREHHRDDHFTVMYEDLSSKFENLVDVVAVVSETTTANEPFNIVAAYERFNRSQSERLKRFLEKQGIFPIKTSQN